ncbi:MAG: phage portal protein [Bosea sp.]|uniref:phage portal protein n=1 Tax=Bosea sp. (in: a-proteobacteria) TaxID=1871050 RepID=UPI001ACCCCE3|nr:phage portal protein [Bosea sp. (in: a-proteobacteria)]MBN9468990.1 phage portal protein [Bosea sp. (in: a-proteobacteria)]
MNWRWPFQKRALTAADLPESLISAPTPAGIPVNASTALHSPTVLGCVRLLSEIVGTLPVHCYRKDTDGSRDRADHAGAAVLARPNPWTGAGEQRTRMMVDALLHGEAFAKVIRVGGKPREFHRLDPSGVTVKIDDRTLEPSYHVAQKTGAPIVLGWRDVLHVQTPGSLPDRPLKLLDMARDAISVDLAMQRYQGRVFGAGARPSAILKVPAKTPPERRKEIKESWDEAHSGGQAGRTALIDDTMDWKAVSFSMVESDFLQLRKHAASEINRTFKVPETLNGNLDRGVWKNVEELTQVFLDFALTPWLDAWQNAYERVLLKVSERGQYFVEFKIDAIAKANLQARYAAYRQAAGGSWMTPDEIRKLDNLPPIEGGSKLLLQAGQAPADQPSQPQEQND